MAKGYFIFYGANILMKNSISFKLWGKYALFTYPVTKLGGEKFTYHVPTYEAIKGVLKSIYWKPTIIWYVDRIRVMKTIRTQTKGTKPLKWSGGNDLAIYTFLRDVEYQVEAHFEWNAYRTELQRDRIDGKHYSIASRMLERGGRQDIFLGVRDCQGYVEPCDFGQGKSDYDNVDELSFGNVFHSFSYPDETGIDELRANFWHATMRNGIIEFLPPEQLQDTSKYIRKMTAKDFQLNKTILPIEQEDKNLLEVNV